MGKEVEGSPGEEVWFVLDLENSKIWFGQLKGKSEEKQWHFHRMHKKRME